MTTKQKTIIFLSWLFWLPAFYLLFSDNRKDKTVAYHSAKAFFYWLYAIIVMSIFRVFVFFVLSNIDVPFLEKTISILNFAIIGYAIYNAYLFSVDKEREIPFVSNISKKLA